MLAVYNYMVRNNKIAYDLQQKKKRFLRELQKCDNSNSKKQSSCTYLKIKLKHITSKELFIKRKLLTQINAALKNLARNHKFDFIFNIGNELIYGKKKYDMTEKVIRNIMQIKKRSAPYVR